ncbi:MAG: hypothetical protein K2N07_10440, partial [Desulfovibrio sp.]|nr:hypothetical protein [Desulfovibrio sp.]
MAAQNPPVPEENAEDIIDLTELIERGDAAPAADAGAQPDNEDAEIEALLAQMDASDGASFSKGPAAPLDAPAPGAAPVVDPNEQLDMSDMGDIDNLLASLDIPPQPQESAAAAAAPAATAAAPQAAMPQDLDAAMDELLGGSTPPPAAPATAPAEASDTMLQDLDAAMDELLGG